MVDCLRSDASKVERSNQNGADLSVIFDHMIGDRKYQTFKEFKIDLIEFQRVTSTSYDIRCSRTAKQYLKIKKKVLPEGVEYKYVTYICVHARKAWLSKKAVRRFKDYDCPARFWIKYEDGCYSISSRNMYHTHVPTASHPYIYPRNRRLNESQRNEVFNLVESNMSPNEIRHYISVTYGLQLAKHDVRRLIEQYYALNSGDYVNSAEVDDSEPVEVALTTDGEQNEVAGELPLDHVEIPENREYLEHTDRCGNVDIVEIVRSLPPESDYLTCFRILAAQFVEGRSVEDSLQICLEQWREHHPRGKVMSSDLKPPISTRCNRGTIAMVCRKANEENISISPIDLKDYSTVPSAAVTSTSILRAQLCASTLKPKTTNKSFAMFTPEPLVDNTSLRSPTDSNPMIPHVAFRKHVVPQILGRNDQTTGTGKSLLKDYFNTDNAK